ncbi:MAG: hypothetical protein AB7F89_18735 [Pirellulaceae bacterium]
MDESIYRPDMPDFGIYAFWPEPGDSWYHPDDAGIVAALIPSNKVLMRVNYDGTYYHLRYGGQRLRVRPTMWQSVPSLDLEVGQSVEILSRHGINEPGIGSIADIFYDSGSGRTRWMVRRNAMQSALAYGREDLRPLDVKVTLRTGFYPHLAPTCDLTQVTSWLNVGSLTDDV